MSANKYTDIIFEITGKIGNYQGTFLILHPHHLLCYFPCIINL